MATKTHRVNEIRWCEQCGDAYQAEKDYRKFCSVRCSAKSQEKIPSPAKISACPVCDATFTAKRPTADIYCSKQCASRSRGITTYGISVAEYRKMYAIQGAACAACSVPFAGIRICIDHCHTTGKVRGLLCSGCNIAAGHIEKRGDQVSAYLARHSLDLLDLCA